MFSSCGLYIPIIFCKQTIAAWRQRLWIDDSDWNESGCLYGFSFQYIILLFQVLFISICNQIIDYFRYQNLLQVDVMPFKLCPYLMSLILHYNNYPVLI
jgi:hypothetical protein